MFARSDFLPLFLVGTMAASDGRIAEMGWIGDVTQLGALGLLAAYLMWTIKERKDERASRNEHAEKELDARKSEIEAIVESHRATLAATIAALHRAYEGRVDENRPPS